MNKYKPTFDINDDSFYWNLNINILNIEVEFTNIFINVTKI